MIEPTPFPVVLYDIREGAISHEDEGDLFVETVTGTLFDSLFRSGLVQEVLGADRETSPLRGD